MPAANANLSAKAQRFQVRVWSGFIFAVSLFILGIGAWMKPSPKGLGTHSENLGLPPCGFYQRTGIPCPTCGCTTAVTHVAHGISELMITGDVSRLPKEWGLAFYTQPFGAVFGFAALAGLLLGGFGLVTARWVGPQPIWIQWYWRSLVFAGSALLAFGWVYKIIITRGMPH